MIPGGPLLGFTALLAAVSCAAGCDGPVTKHPAVGRSIGPLPLVSLVDPRAPQPRLEGRVTLLAMWATWCGPCRLELPGLVRLADRLAGEPRFQLLAVSCGSDDPTELAAETRALLDRQRLALAAWAFSDRLSRSLFASAHGLAGLPTTYLVDADARVRRVWTGYRARNEAEMAAAVLELLGEAASAAR